MQVSNNIVKRIAYSGPGYVSKKEAYFVKAPMPGPFKKFKSISALLLLRDVLSFAKNKKEAKYILNKRALLVNTKAVKDLGFAISLFDIIDFPLIKKKYTLVPDKYKLLKLKEIDYSTKDYRLCRIESKKSIKDAFVYGFDNGFNIVSKENYMVNDVVVYDLKNKKILQHIPFEEGSRVIFVDGAHISEVGHIKKIIPGSETIRPEVIVKTKKGDIRSLVKYVFLVPDDFDYVLQ